jgi:hypothetical protein
MRLCGLYRLIRFRIYMLQNEFGALDAYFFFFDTDVCLENVT